MVRAMTRQRLQWRNAMTAQRVTAWSDPLVDASLLRMRKLLDVDRGDWQALVKHVRDSTKLKTGVLSARAGVSPETWWRWENKGQRPKDADVVERFARAFGLEVDDAMWAAALLIDDQTPEADPRLRGLDHQDPVVIHIMGLDIDEEMRGYMLDRRRQILALRREQDILEVDIIARRERGAA